MTTQLTREYATAIEAELRHLSSEARVVFAAACAQRVLPIVVKYSQGPLAEAALSKAWSFGGTGSVTEVEARRLIALYDAEIDSLYDEEETDFVLDAVFAPYHALCAVLPDQDFTAAKSASGSAANATYLGDRNGGPARVEAERAWQLDLIRTIGEQGVAKLRNDVQTSSPAWMDLFEN